MSKPAAAAKIAQPDVSERELAKKVAFALPVVTLIVALSVGMLSSIGPAILVLAGGALLGTIALFWASVRTLSGDAPLPEDLEAFAARRHAVNDADERKRRILRALKDLEHEHQVGKIDDADYEELAASYRQQAKEVMREMDADVAPLRVKAEALARAHLAKAGLIEGESAAEEQEPLPALVAPAGKRACPKCSTANDTDARFCKSCGATMESADASA